MLFRGYRAASEGSAHGAALAAPRASAAFRTGDLGWLDDRGRLVVIGRSDDMVITGGENVHPSEVEEALRAQLAAAAAADPEREAVVRADKDVPFERVVRVLDAVRT